MPSKPRQKQKLHRWHISQIRKKGEFVGIVEAPDAEAAIKEAIEQWDIREKWKQDRLVARREA